jgi:cysteine desulfurase family protein (TIGR01976 family)
MNYDVDAIRRHFPSLSIRDNGTSRIYFDNPAGTQIAKSVAERITECLLESNANVCGSFETSRRADAVIAGARAAMADFLNAASPEEIVFGQNMTTITLHISRSIGRTLRPGDEIIVSHMDHDANVTPWTLLAEDLDLKVKWLTFNTETFEYDLDELDSLLSDRTKLVCVGGASNLIGTINDVRTICAKARAAGALSYVDAVQLAPHVAIDVQDLGSDFLVCSAYKFFGPHQGILWGRRDVLESLVPYKVRPATSEIPSCFETGTQSHEGLAGTAAAVNYFAWVGENLATDYHHKHEQYRTRTKYVHSALDYLFAYEKKLAAHLIDGLQNIDGIQIQGITALDAQDRRVPTVSFTANSRSSASIAEALGQRNIFVWSGHCYAVGITKALGIHESGGVVRIGPVHYNSIEEIDELLVALDEILLQADVA